MSEVVLLRKVRTLMDARAGNKDLLTGISMDTTSHTHDHRDDLGWCVPAASWFT